MARRSPLRTGIYVAHADDTGGDRVWRPDPARQGRAAAMQRRRLLSQGKQALNGSGRRTAAAADAGAPTLVVHRGGAG